MTWFFGLNNASHASWILCTTPGSVLGGSITDTHAPGFDFALAAMFTALLVLQIAGRPKVRAAIAAAGAVAGGVAVMALLRLALG